MATTRIPRTKVAISENSQVTYRERKILLGLVKWWEKVSSVKIGNDLLIFTDIEIKDIYLNGKSLQDTNNNK